MDSRISGPAVVSIVPVARVVYVVVADRAVFDAIPATAAATHEYEQLISKSIAVRDALVVFQWFREQDQP